MTRILVVVALIGVAAAPGLALAPAYVEPNLVRGLLSGWAVAAVLITGLLHRRFTASAALIVGLVPAFAGVAALVAAFSGPEPRLLYGTLDAVVHSGARILTSSLPTAVAADTLALPALAVWLSGAAATLAVRSGYPLSGALCPLLALIGAAVLNGPELSPAYFPTALFALGAVLLLAASTRTDQLPGPGSVQATPIGAGTQTGRTGRFARSLPRALSLGCVLALVASLTTYIGPLALYGSPIRPADLRAEVTPPEEDTAGASPLSYLPAWAAEPGRRLMTVTAEEPTELRWVTLSDFDGVTWLPESRFRASSEVLPAPEREVPSGPDREVTIEVGELPGHWLPVVGVPRHVSGTAVAYEPASATLRTGTGHAEGTEYTVTGQVPEYKEEALKKAEEPDKEEFERYLQLPEDPPPQIEEIAAAVSDGTPYERANRLAAHLRSNYGFDPDSPGGHGYANLADFLVSPGTKGGGGTSGQFASAFALLARASGLPSRVVVGFGPGTDEGGQTHTIRTGDAVAWGEVYLEGVGWAPFDVTPGEPKQNGASQEPEGGSGSEGASSTWGVQRPEEDTGIFRSTGAYLDVAYAWAMVGRAAAGLATALVAGTLLVGVLRGTRRWLRLRAKDPRQRILGAWRELYDGLRLAGTAPRPSDTVSEVLVRSDGLLPTADGRPRPWTLGRTMNAMAFMGDGSAGVSAHSAQLAADEVQTYTAALRSRLSRPRRLLWWLDPRPLFWSRP